MSNADLTDIYRQLAPDKACKRRLLVGIYPIEGFIATQYEQDIVWADGFFVRYPTGVIQATAGGS